MYETLRNWSILTPRDRMTYYVSGGTVNITHSLTIFRSCSKLPNKSAIGDIPLVNSLFLYLSAGTIYLSLFMIHVTWTIPPSTKNISVPTGLCARATWLLRPIYARYKFPHWTEQPIRDV